MKLFLTIAFTIFLTGCAQNKIETFQKASSDSAKIYDVNTINSLTAVPLESSIIKASLSKDDPIINIDKNISAMDLYSLSKEKGTYTITIRNYCDCFGFHKNMLLPKIYIVDNKNKLVELKIGSKEKVQPALGSFYFESKIKLDINSNATQKLLIVSSNTNLGEVTTKLNAVGSAGIPGGSSIIYSIFPIELDVTSAPYGKYEIGIAK